MCLVQVAIALVKSMKLQDGRDEAQQAEFFAKSLHNGWGVGDATCNNGLLLFLSQDDRQVPHQSNVAVPSAPWTIVSEQSQRLVQLIF